MRYIGYMQHVFNLFKKRFHQDHSSVYFGLGLLIFLVSGLVVMSLSLSDSQDLRQQAATCNENPVNVEFRHYTGQDTPGWTSGSTFKANVGDKIDVNCFSKNGLALLSYGRIDGYLDGLKVLDSRPTDIRGLTISKGGAYKFVCSNGAGCYDSDSFIVTDTTSPPPKPSPDPSPAPVGCKWEKVECVQAPCDPILVCEHSSPSPTLTPRVSPPPTTPPSGCPKEYASDLNNDCTVDVLDYNVFLEDFRNNVSTN